MNAFLKLTASSIGSFGAEPAYRIGSLFCGAEMARTKWLAMLSPWLVTAQECLALDLKCTVDPKGGISLRLSNIPCSPMARSFLGDDPSAPVWLPKYVRSVKSKPWEWVIYLQMSSRSPNSEPSCLILNFFYIPSTYLPAHMGLFTCQHTFFLANTRLSILKLIIRKVIFGWIPQWLIISPVLLVLSTHWLGFSLITT